MEVVKLLIARGADVNAKRGGFGLTPLFFAATGLRGMDLSNWPLFYIGERPRSHFPLGGRRRINPSPDAQEIMKLLLHHGADVSARERSCGLVPLHYAIYGGQPGTVETLLRHGADVNAEGHVPAGTQRYITPLHLAAHFGDLETCRLLIERDADVNLRMPAKDGLVTVGPLQSPLHHAASSGNAKLVELLMEQGANVNALNSSNETPLHRAARRGATSAVKALLSRGAEANIANAYGQTPLHHAVQEEDRASVELLLSYGADANPENRRGETPTSIAMENGSAGIVRLLAAHLDEVTLHSAASMGDMEGMAALLDSGVEINHVDAKGRIALNYAIRAAQVKAVRWLLTEGADPNRPDRGFESPLLVASNIGRDVTSPSDPNEIDRSNSLRLRQKQIMTLLLRRGAAESASLGIASETVRTQAKKVADLIVEADLGVGAKWPLLHTAAWRGQRDVVVELLELGADIHATDDEGGTALHAALQIGWTDYQHSNHYPRLDVLELLLERGANVNALTIRRVTPLHGAASQASVNAVALLIKLGADVNAVDEANRTPLHEAAEQWNSADIMPLLIGQGADPNALDENGNSPLLLLLSPLLLDREEDVGASGVSPGVSL